MQLAIMMRILLLLVMISTEKYDINNKIKKAACNFMINRRLHRCITGIEDIDQLITALLDPTTAVKLSLITRTHLPLLHLFPLSLLQFSKSIHDYAASPEIVTIKQIVKNNVFFKKSENKLFGNRSIFELLLHWQLHVSIPSDEFIQALLQSIELGHTNQVVSAMPILSDLYRNKIMKSSPVDENNWLILLMAFISVNFHPQYFSTNMEKIKNALTAVLSQIKDETFKRKLEHSVSVILLSYQVATEKNLTNKKKLLHYWIEKITSIDKPYINLANFGFSVSELNMDSVDLRHVQFNYCILSHSHLISVDLSGINADKVKMLHCRLIKLLLHGCSLVGAHICDSELIDLDFSTCYMTSTTMNTCMLKNVSIKNQNLSTNDFLNCIFVDTDFNGSVIALANLSGSCLSGNDLRGAIFLLPSQESKEYDPVIMIGCRLLDETIAQLIHHRVIFNLRDFVKSILRGDFKVYGISKRESDELSKERYFILLQRSCVVLLDNKIRQLKTISHSKEIIESKIDVLSCLKTVLQACENIQVMIKVLYRWNNLKDASCEFTYGDILKTPTNYVGYAFNFFETSSQNLLNDMLFAAQKIQAIFEPEVQFNLCTGSLPYLPRALL